MSLYKKWTNLIENQTKESINEFWEEYASGETVIYKDILANKQNTLQGKIGELSEKYKVRPEIFMGFLDGINTSLKSPLNLDELDENSDISLDIDLEMLFKNMIKANADYLYTLEEWLGIFDEEKQMELANEYRRSRTVVKEAKIGRNEPCTCGSGKKYKKCCGK